MPEKFRSILGAGWAFPPVFTQGGADVRLVSDEEDIQQSLEIILSTGINERIMQEDFGAELSDFLFEEMDQSLINGIESTVSDALINHEPRIELEEVNVSADGATHGLLLIGIIYTVISTNTRYNMVYPFYLNEAN